MKKAIIVVAVLSMLLAAGWTRQMLYPFPQANQTWKVKFGDTSETQIAFNIALLRHKVMELEQKIQEKDVRVPDPNE